MDTLAIPRDSNLSRPDEGASLTAMSRHHVPGSSTDGGKASLFGSLRSGARLALCEAVPPRWGACARVFAGTLAFALLSGCLVTDQIELPAVPQIPPIVRLDGYDVDDGDAVIVFDRSNTELLVNLRIRDEDRTETLKMRWKIESGTRPQGAFAREYPCPGEPEILGDGTTLTRKTTLPVRGSSFAPGTCNRVDVIVSGSFKTCRPESDPDDWDNTTQDEDDPYIGRLSFWVWAFDAPNDPRVQPAAALALLTSCEQLDYTPPSPTATSTSAATPGM